MEARVSVLEQRMDSVEEIAKSAHDNFNKVSISVHQMVAKVGLLQWLVGLLFTTNLVGVITLIIYVAKVP